MKNSEGDYWHPGMNWFRPRQATCQEMGCSNKFTKKAQTGRKYCDDCQTARERAKRKARYQRDGK